MYTHCTHALHTHIARACAHAHTRTHTHTHTHTHTSMLPASRTARGEAGGRLSWTSPPYTHTFTHTAHAHTALCTVHVYICARTHNCMYVHTFAQPDVCSHSVCAHTIVCMYAHCTHTHPARGEAGGRHCGLPGHHLSQARLRLLEQAWRHP